MEWFLQQRETHTALLHCITVFMSQKHMDSFLVHVFISDSLLKKKKKTTAIVPLMHVSLWIETAWPASRARTINPAQAGSPGPKSTAQNPRRWNIRTLIKGHTHTGTGTPSKAMYVRRHDNSVSRWHRRCHNGGLVPVRKNARSKGKILSKTIERGLKIRIIRVMVKYYIYNWCKYTASVLLLQDR